MRKTRLSSSEIQDLINKYQSELKKLEFQIEDVKSTIADLENWLESVELSEKTALAKMGRKRKKTSITVSEPGAKRTKRGRPARKDTKSSDATITSEKSRTKKIKSTKGYKLSKWDEWVIEAITQKGKPQITKGIIESVKISSKGTGLQSNDEEIKNKVIRSLQKLANRRSDLIKVPYKGKGYAYAVPGMPGAKRIVHRKLKKK